MSGLQSKPDSHRRCRAVRDRNVTVLARVSTLTYRASSVPPDSVVIAVIGPNFDRNPTALQLKSGCIATASTTAASDNNSIQSD